jgi:hypothetical protein
VFLFAQIVGLIYFAFFQRYEIVNGVVEVDGVSDEPTSDNAEEGKESDGMRLNFNSCISSHSGYLIYICTIYQLKEFQIFGLLL